MQGANEQAWCRGNCVKDITPQMITRFCRRMVALSPDMLRKRLLYGCFCKVYGLFFLTSENRSGRNRLSYMTLRHN